MCPWAAYNPGWQLESLVIVRSLLGLRRERGAEADAVSLQEGEKWWDW